MPRVHRRLKRKSDGYDEDHVHQLQYGWTIMAGLGFGHLCSSAANDFDDDAAREAWGVMGEKLLADWTRERPGTRPWAWWRYSSPERRRRVDGVVHPHDDRVRRLKADEIAKLNPRFATTAYKTDYGVPTCLFTTDDFSARYESELDYLRRLNLLAPAERTLLCHE